MTLRTRTAIKIKKRLDNSLPGGSYAEYIQISPKKGIKLYYAKCDSTTEPTFKRTLQMAHYEVYFYKLARERYPFVPKCYGVQVIKVKDRYNSDVFRIGIVLQHLGNTTLSDVGYGRNDSSPFAGRYPATELNTKLKSRGIYHGDLHDGNVMYYKGQLWVIDFGHAELIQP